MWQKQKHSCLNFCIENEIIGRSITIYHVWTNWGQPYMCLGKQVWLWVRAFFTVIVAFDGLVHMDKLCLFWGFVSINPKWVCHWISPGWHASAILTSTPAVMADRRSRGRKSSIMMSGKMRSGARYSPRSPSAMAGGAMEVRTAFTPHKERDLARLRRPETVNCIK